MCWRNKFPNRFGPRGFAGVVLGRWLGVFRRIDPGVDPPYWGRASPSMPTTSPTSWSPTAGSTRGADGVTPLARPVERLSAWREGRLRVEAERFTGSGEPVRS